MTLDGEESGSVVIQSDGKMIVRGRSQHDSNHDFTGEVLQVVSPHGFEVDRSGMGSGQLILRPNDTSDGLNRLQVAGIDFAMPSGVLGSTKDADQTLVPSTVNLADLNSHREVRHRQGCRQVSL